MLTMLKILGEKRAYLLNAVLILLISGCGLKGPLYQTPTKTPSNQTEQAKTPAASPSQEKN